jgi:hypothetical protein
VPCRPLPITSASVEPQAVKRQSQEMALPSDSRQGPGTAFGTPAVRVSADRNSGRELSQARTALPSPRLGHHRLLPDALRRTRAPRASVATHHVGNSCAPRCAGNRATANLIRDADRKGKYSLGLGRETPFCLARRLPRLRRLKRLCSGTISLEQDTDFPD